MDQQTNENNKQTKPSQDKTNKTNKTQSNKQTNKQTNKQANNQTSKQTNRQTDKQTNRQTKHTPTIKQTSSHTRIIAYTEYDSCDLKRFENSPASCPLAQSEKFEKRQRPPFLLQIDILLFSSQKGSLPNPQLHRSLVPADFSALVICTISFWSHARSV